MLSLTHKHYKHTYIHTHTYIVVQLFSGPNIELFLYEVTDKACGRERALISSHV